MIFRTDLALEAIAMAPSSGVITKEEQFQDCTVTRVKILPAISKRIGKAAGNYITLQLPAFSDNAHDGDRYISILAKEIRSMLPGGTVLVAGLGNREITPDALGPKTADKIVATRKIGEELARVSGLSALRPVAVLTPGVLGSTGMETAEILQILSQKIQPSAVLVIDALAAQELDRLGCTVQLSDAGISPGEGVGNQRPKIDMETLGVPVLCLGVPTVVSAAVFAGDLLGASDSDKASLEKIIAPTSNIMVTTREVDLMISRASKLLSMAVNVALNPEFTPEEFLRLCS